MKGELRTAGKCSWTTQGAADKVIKHGGVRLLVLKASNRAAVHGTKLPVPDMVDEEEEVKMDIQKAKEEKEKRRKEIEETVDSQLKKKNLELLSDLPRPHQRE